MSYTSIALAVLIVLIAAGGTAYLYGRHHARLECVAAAAQAQDKQVQRDNAAAVTGHQVARQAEHKRDAIDAYFAGLQAEAARATTHDAADCELDPDGLRRWRAANAWPDGDPAGEPDAAVPGPAPAGGWKAEGVVGAQSPRGSAALSPVSRAAQGVGRVAREDQRGAEQGRAVVR